MASSAFSSASTRDRGDRHGAACDWRSYRGGATETTREAPVPLTVTRCLECGAQSEKAADQPPALSALPKASSD